MESCSFQCYPLKTCQIPTGGEKTDLHIQLIFFVLSAMGLEVNDNIIR